MVHEKKCPLIGKRKIIPPLCRNISFSIKKLLRQCLPPPLRP